MRPFRSRRSTILGAVALIVAVLGTLALVGFLGGRSSDLSLFGERLRQVTGGGESTGAPGPSSATPGKDQAQDGQEPNLTPAVLPTVQGLDRFLVRTGQLILVVPRGAIDRSVAAIITLTQGYGGYVLSSYVGTTQPGQPPYPVPLEGASPEGVKQSTDGQVLPDTQGGEPYAYITVRIPARQFDTAILRFRQMGTVRQLSTSADDVTSQMVDLQARLTHYKAVLTRLLTFLDKADTVGAALAVQNRIDQTQLTVEELTAQLKQLRETVSYSTLSVSLSEKAPKPGVYGNTNSFWGSLKHSLGLVTDGARFTFVAIGAALPFLVLAAVAFAVLFFVLRASARRRRSRQLSAAAASDPPAIGGESA